MSDFFQQMNDDAAAAEAAGEKQMTFQERIVKQLIRYAGAPLNLGRAKAEAKIHYGTTDLGFRWFHDTYPAFPVTLFSQKIRSAHVATIGDIYGKGRFQKLPWWREYEDQAGTYGIDLRADRAALLFNLPYASQAFLMVLHNQPVQADLSHLVQDAEYRQDDPWPRTTFPMGRSGIVAVLEAFPSFMQTVGKEWAAA